MRRALHDHGTLLERIAVRAAADRHRHVFRYEGPCAVVAGFDAYRCTHCPKLTFRRQEAS